MRSFYGEGRRIADVFFTRISADSDHYVCRCGKHRKKAGTSYANLMSHVKTAHSEYKSTMNTDGSSKQTDIDKHFEVVKPNLLHGWHGLIITSLLPSSTLESRVFREHVKQESVSLSTFMRYLSRLTRVVESKISRLLPNRMELFLMDGQ